MKQGFEDKLTSLQEGLVSLCLELVDNNAEMVYIYCSMEEHSTSFNALFRINGKIRHTGEITDNKDLIHKFLGLGLADTLGIRELCTNNEYRVPNEIKIIYNVQTGNIDISYKYEPVCDGDMENSSYDIFTEWLEELKQSTT